MAHQLGVLRSTEEAFLIPPSNPGLEYCLVFEQHRDRTHLVLSMDLANAVSGAQQKIPSNLKLPRTLIATLNNLK